jgi:hypothetical protein
VFRFPETVDERAARTVATGVVVLAALAVGLGQRWLLFVLLYGFLARVLTGPRLSPLALLATRVVVPRLPFRERISPGPPKRLAQGMGAAMVLTAIVLSYGFGATTAAWIVVGALIGAAGLEAAFGLCLACRLFAAGMRLGLVPREACEACADIWARQPAG